MKLRAANWLSIVGLLFAVLVFDGRWLSGRIPRGEDNWLAFVPAYSIGEGHWPPRWNPYVCGGMPCAANPQYSAWYPPRWIFAFATALVAYGPYCFGHFVLAALAMFVCLRALGCGPPGAAIGALSFVCGSYIQGHLSNPGLLFSSVWLPLVVVCSFRAVARRGWLWPTWLGLVMAVVVFAGSPHNMFYAVLIVGLVAVWECGTGILPVRWTQRSKAGNPAADNHGQDARATLGHLALAAVLALGLSAVQMIPTAEFARLTFRQSLSLGDLARDPLAWSWLGSLFVGSPAPWATEYLDKSTYFGMSVLPLMLLAIAAPFVEAQHAVPGQRPRRYEWFFAALAVVGVWIALGTQAGAFQLLGCLPVVRFLSGPSRALVLFALGTSALVGFGADAFLRREDWKKCRTFWFILCAGAILAAILFLPKCFRLTWQDIAGIAGRATSPRAVSLFPAINGAVFLGLGVLLLGGAAILPARFHAKRWYGLAAAVLLFLDLLHFRQRLPLPVSTRDDLAPPETAAAVLRDSSRPFRVVGYEPTRLNPGDMNDRSLREFLMPNLAALYGLQDIQGFDPLILDDYVRLVQATAGRSPIDDPARTLNVARPDAMLFRLLNVRYVIGDVRERRLVAWPPITNGVGTIPLDKPTTLVGVSIVTLLDRARELADGTTVAIVTAVGAANHGQDAHAPAAIRAGVETADWRKADPRFFCRHKSARENMSWEVLTPSGPVRVANYWAQVSFNRPVLARAIEIRQAVEGIVFKVAMVAAVLPEPPGWEKVFERDRYRIYRNRDVLGGAWLVHRVRRVGDEAEALALLAKDEVDVAREAIVSEQTDSNSKLQVSGFKEPQGGERDSASADRVEFVRYEADRIEVRTESSQPALLCFAENFYPGWTAERDGARAEVVRVNYVLRGVVLPTSGAHSVTLRFAPRSLAVGKTISAITFILALALLVAGLKFRVSALKSAGPARLGRNEATDPDAESRKRVADQNPQMGTD